MLVVCTFYTVNRVLTICYGLITSTRIVAIFFWTTAFHLTINTKTWIPTWLFTVIPDESNRTIWNDIIFCFLEFYSLFVRMDYINIKKSSHSARTSVFPKMILVFFSWELYHLLHGNQGPHRSYKCAYMRKSKQMSTRCHVISCWYM